MNSSLRAHMTEGGSRASVLSREQQRKAAQKRAAGRGPHAQVLASRVEELDARAGQWVRQAGSMNALSNSPTAICVEFVEQRAHHRRLHAAPARQAIALRVQPHVFQCL